MNLQIAGMAALAISAAMGLSFAALWMLDRVNRAQQAAAPVGSAAALSFLFQHGILVDTTEAAQLLISISGRPVTTVEHLSALLAQRFPTLNSAICNMGPQQQHSLYAADHTEIAVLSRHHDRLRVTLTEVEAPDDLLTLDRPTLISFERELASLRGTTEHMPFLVWRQDAAGAITWVNRAYLDACHTFGDPARAGLWPPCRLFDIDLHSAMTQTVAARSQRHRLGGDGGKPTHWYQFHITRLDDDFLISGMNVDTVVEAEDSLRTFVQTLSKTFADLPIGLAVFTRDRRLALFNPALADLTGIAPERLIQRPTIFGFFDMLRDLQMMPEPKNYNTWRDQIADLEASANDGTYRETWHLPFGRTFRVTGQPQIDGAVALLFEDISDEIGLNRRYRTELELGQSVLDTLPQAMAVFSSSGVLTLTNSAYDALWETETREGLDTLFIADAARHWADRCAPSPMWAQVRDFVVTDRRHAPFLGDAMLLDGRPLCCALRPLTGGATLVQFQIQTDLPRRVHPVPTGPREGRVAAEG